MSIEQTNELRESMKDGEWILVAKKKGQLYGAKVDNQEDLQDLLNVAKITDLSTL